MKQATIIVTLGVVFLAGLIVEQQFLLLDWTWGRVADSSNQPLTDEARRQFYLMPPKDSEDWQEWVAKYGDTADSWELFTIGYHTNYLKQLTARVNELARGPNDPPTVDLGATE